MTNLNNNDYLSDVCIVHTVRNDNLWSSKVHVYAKILLASLVTGASFQLITAQRK